MLHPVALDVGFASLKAADDREVLIQASAVAPNVSLIRGLGQTHTTDLIVNDEDGTEWLVGDLAVRQAPAEAMWSNLAERDSDPVFRRLLRTSLAYFANGNDSFALVTGLPVSQYLTGKQKLEDWLTGRKMNVTLSVNGEKRTNVITIDRAAVWPQPYGSHLYLVLNADGSDNKVAEYSDARKVIIDVGGGTVDVLAVDGDMPRRNLAGTMRGSMNDIYSQVAQQISVPAIEVEQAYIDRDPDVVARVEPKIDALASRIAAFALNLLNPTLYRPEVLLITGGVSEVIHQPLIKAMQFEGKVFTCPAEANALGFLRGAKRLWKS